jgi:hypothetical protein
MLCMAGWCPKTGMDTHGSLNPTLRGQQDGIVLKWQVGIGSNAEL